MNNAIQNNKPLVEVTAIQMQDAKVLQKLVNEIWNDYYPDIIGADQVAYMLGSFYNLNAIEKNIIDPHFHYYFVRFKAQIVGYIGIKHYADQPLFWSQFYIHPKWGGKGLGLQVFNRVLDYYKPNTIRLTVNRFNIKAINFYFKLGFKIREVANFDIGAGYVMEDFVMEWQARHI